MNNTSYVLCKNCGTFFLREVSRINEAIKNGSEQFCSRSCLAAHKTTTVPCACSNCGKGLSVLYGVYTRSMSKRFFCGNSCAAVYNNSRKPPRSEESRKRTSDAVIARLSAAGHQPKERVVREGRAINPRVLKVCENCGGPYKGSAGGTQKYCSKSCYTLATSVIPVMTKDELLSWLKSYYTEHGIISSKIVPFSIRRQARNLFGTWNSALEKAGVKLATSNRGRKGVVCHDGHSADSTEEALIDNWLSSHGLAHDRDKYYPGTRMTCDFYLIEYDVWIEYLGLYVTDDSYRARFEEKKRIAAENSTTIIGVLPSDIRGGVDKLSALLASFTTTKVPHREYLGHPGAPVSTVVCLFCVCTFSKLERKHKSDIKRGQTKFFCCRSHQVSYQHAHSV